MNCSNGNKYQKNGICCDRCAAGEYVRTECDSEKPTECAECRREYFTSAANHLKRCQRCRYCDPSNHLRKLKECTGKEDTVCECEDGFYCSDPQCEHCNPATMCSEGQGVKFKATRTNNTVCAVCEDGTFNNVTDSISPCRSHTRCEAIGRDQKTAGTSTTDAICGGLKTHCPWMLPTGLWSGLVLTALILFGLACWRAKRKSYRTGRSSVPVPVVEVVAAVPITRLELPLHFTELNGHCQESCPMEDCKLPLFNADDDPISSIKKDSVDISRPITPLKVSVSFTESNHIAESDGFSTGNFLRTYSEPQEDEWCGT
ncbi:tumor necrosis factor receptor superfamily member 5 [Centropristis striata]|uniref:tumor necrosis factor receptor superfamily member 5 n=1 Tax=Centropristis striata TaxID=184440 RepID=UPI0027E15340|nr:tumor necrosis factor receptor superfamily member 5 [Centropristis striata]